MKLNTTLFIIVSSMFLQGCMNREKTQHPKKEKKVVKKKKQEIKKKIQRHAYARNWLTEDLTDYLA